jgi:hypothetical protein
MGEGLSVLAAQTLHPAGYYATGSGPRIDTWFRNGRPDFIGQNEATDKNQISYGCAVLFLNYLRYQESFSFRQIIDAAGPFQVLGFVGGVSLATVFSRLTGRPASTAYTEFTALLQAHIPSSESFTALSDNIFPLRTAKQRSVVFAPSEIELNAIQDAESLLVSAKAGPMCPRSGYSYHNIAVSSQLTLTGRAFGFAQPQFAWSVNGVALNAGSQDITVAHNAIDTVPGRDEKAVNVDLTLRCVVDVAGGVGTLTILNASSPGNGPLTVSFSATESLISGDTPTNFTDTPWLVTRRYSMNGAWDRDVDRCNVQDLGLMHETVKSLAGLVVADENRPNIKPGAIRALAAATARYVEILDEVTNGSRGLDRSVSGILRRDGAIRAALGAQSLPGVEGGLPMRRNTVRSRLEQSHRADREPTAPTTNEPRYES